MPKRQIFLTSFALVFLQLFSFSSSAENVNLALSRDDCWFISWFSGEEANLAWCHSDQHILYSVSNDGTRHQLHELDNSWEFIGWGERESDVLSIFYSGNENKFTEIALSEDAIRSDGETAQRFFEIAGLNPNDDGSLEGHRNYTTNFDRNCIAAVRTDLFSGDIHALFIDIDKLHDELDAFVDTIVIPDTDENDYGNWREANDVICYEDNGVRFATFTVYSPAGPRNSSSPDVSIQAINFETGQISEVFTSEFENRGRLSVSPIHEGVSIISTSEPVLYFVELPEWQITHRLPIDRSHEFVWASHDFHHFITLHKDFQNRGFESYVNWTDCNPGENFCSEVIELPEGSTVYRPLNRTLADTNHLLVEDDTGLIWPFELLENLE